MPQTIICSFYSGPGSKCLDDPPRISLPGFNYSAKADRNLPGVLFDGDTQCEFLYGVGWRHCSFEKARLLLMLWKFTKQNFTN